MMLLPWPLPLCECQVCLLSYYASSGSYSNIVVLNPAWRRLKRHHSLLFPLVSSLYVQPKQISDFNTGVTLIFLSSSLQASEQVRVPLNYIQKYLSKNSQLIYLEDDKGDGAW